MSCSAETSTGVLFSDQIQSTCIDERNQQHKAVADFGQGTETCVNTFEAGSVVGGLKERKRGNGVAASSLKWGRRDGGLDNSESTIPSSSWPPHSAPDGIGSRIIWSYRSFSNLERGRDIHHDDRRDNSVSLECRLNLDINSCEDTS